MIVYLEMSKEFRKDYAIRTGVSLDMETVHTVDPASLPEVVRRIVLEYGSRDGVTYPEGLRQLEYLPNGATYNRSFSLRADVAPEDVTPEVITAAILVAALELETDRANKAIGALMAKQDQEVARAALDKKIEEFLADDEAMSAPFIPGGHPKYQQVYATATAREKAAEKAKRQKEELPRRLWLEKYGTDNEKEMLEAGVLDMKEVDRAMEGYVFLLVDLPLFEYPTRVDMELKDLTEGDGGTLSFGYFDHKGPLTEEVWVAFKKAQEEVEKALRDRAGIIKITLRQYTAYWDMEPWPELRRWAVEVKASAFGLVFTRWFCLPGAPDWVAENEESTVTNQ